MVLISDEICKKQVEVIIKLFTDFVIVAQIRKSSIDVPDDFDINKFYLL